MLWLQTTLRCVTNSREVVNVVMGRDVDSHMNREILRIIERRLFANTGKCTRNPCMYMHDNIDNVNWNMDDSEDSSDDNDVSEDSSEDFESSESETGSEDGITFVSTLVSGDNSKLKQGYW